jgi:signal transduction histidine kinase
MLIISDELIENSRFAYIVFEISQSLDIELEFANPAARKLLNFERMSNSSLAYLADSNPYIKQLEQLLDKFKASESAYKRYTVRLAGDFYTAHFTQLSYKRVLLEMVKEFEHDLSETTHELKRPIQNIKTLTETLLRGAKDDALMCNKFLNSINDEVDRLGEMVQNLLKLSSIDTAEGTVFFVNVDLKDIVLNELENIKEKAKDIKLDFNCDQAINLVCDKDLASHLIANLLDNAVKYNVEQGFISISLNDKALRIINTTNALKEADLTKLFSKFYRSQNSNGIKGSGLGLAIVQKIADVHAWKLSANLLAENQLEITVSF